MTHCERWLLHAIIAVMPRSPDTELPDDYTIQVRVFMDKQSGEKVMQIDPVTMRALTELLKEQRVKASQVVALLGAIQDRQGNLVTDLLGKVDRFFRLQKKRSTRRSAQDQEENN